jgi:hypothetical protein
MTIPNLSLVSEPKRRNYDCFICYASQDERFALAAANDLRLHGLTVFVARLSIAPGDQWSAAIKNAMRGSDWVIFLAGRHARQSPYALQEVGAAIFGMKRFIPIVWDCAPAELPGWSKEYQAIDLRGMTPVQIRDRILAVAAAVKASKHERTTAGLVAGALMFGLFAAAASEAPAGGGRKRR